MRMVRGRIDWVAAAAMWSKVRGGDAPAAAVNRRSGGLTFLRRRYVYTLVSISTITG
jgi:hypothetical protein